MMPEVIFHQHAAEWLAARRAPSVAVARPAPEPLWRSIVQWLGMSRRDWPRAFEEIDMPKIVGISGSASPLSRTRNIIETATRRVADETGGSVHLISISDLVPYLGIAVRGDAAAPVQDALWRIETADLVEYTSLAGVPVALIATGGSDRHALVVEHHLRPLFGFFSARTLPTGLFILDKAIVGTGIEDPLTASRFDQLVREAVDALAPVRAAQTALSAS
jgi:FMN reductase